MLPAPEIESLRSDLVSDDASDASVCGRCFELNLSAELEEGENTKISIPGCFDFQFDSKSVSFNDISFDFDFDLGKNIDVKMYVDVTIAEVFFNNGAISFTKCFEEIKDGAELSVKSSGKVCKYSLYKLVGRALSTDEA